MGSEIRTIEDGEEGSVVFFHWVDSSDHHTLYVDFEKASLKGFIINHLYFFYSQYLFKICSLGYFPPFFDQNFADHSDSTKS